SLQCLCHYGVDDLVVIHVAPPVRCNIGILLNGNGNFVYRPLMLRPHPGRFRAIDTAPQDGTVIEVIHGPKQSVTRAYWSGQTQAFVRNDAETPKTLHRV